MAVLLIGRKFYIKFWNLAKPRCLITAVESLDIYEIVKKDTENIIYSLNCFGTENEDKEREEYKKYLAKKAVNEYPEQNKEEYAREMCLEQMSSQKPQDPDFNHLQEQIYQAGVLRNEIFLKYKKQPRRKCSKKPIFKESNVEGKITNHPTTTQKKDC
ncbi:unnamed protein product [Phyllotreta striolata]|uniref:Uncharacterized protein n=1 Tax=Phyllotreta striolata TaxID=444603 RepID=A0A9N9XRC4_PHYSR|nr:unnamed protein product [Phyllotreta striolata]